MAANDGVTFYNFFLEKNKDYNPNGRFQTEAEAKIVRDNLLTWLDANEISYTNMTCPDNYRVPEILNKIGIV
jgi:hypothetical protein